MDPHERRYRAKWAFITVGTALVTLVALYAFIISAWSDAGLVLD